MRRRKKVRTFVEETDLFDFSNMKKVNDNIKISAPVSTQLVTNTGSTSAVSGSAKGKDETTGPTDY